MRYFFDTYAIIEIIKNNENYSEFLDEDIVTSMLNLGELYYALLRDFNEEVAEFWYNKLKNSLLFIDSDTIIKSMKFRFKHKKMKFSFVDCVGYILAIDNNLIFLTGDKAFENFENVGYVK